MDQLSGQAGGPDPTAVTAVVFDFDGLLVDTEAPGFESWRAVYRRHGVELSRQRWIGAIGVADHFDPAEELAELADRPVDTRAARAARRALLGALADQQPLRPGAGAWVEAAREAGLSLAIASSSQTGWVRGHLERLGLDACFPVVVGADQVGGAGKPAPDVYRRALSRLDVGPEEAVAVEDSLPGLRAAREAGLTTIAVPNDLTRPEVDEEAADLVLGSFEELGLTEALTVLGRWDGAGRAH